MIVKQETSVLGKTDRVKLVQLEISSFFSSQKHDNKSNGINVTQKEIPQILPGKSLSQKGRKSKPAKPSTLSKKRGTRKARIDVLSQSTISDKETRINQKHGIYQFKTCARNVKMEVEKADNNDCNTQSQSNKLNKENQQNLKDLLEQDKTLSYENGLLTIKLEDSDSDDNDQENQIDESSSKRCNDGSASPSKKIKHDSQSKSKARKSLFHDDDIKTENQSTDDIIVIDDVNDGDADKETNANSAAIFDEDTTDLYEYGVPVHELELYSPSMYDTLQLNTSTAGNVSQSVNISQPSPIIKSKPSESSQQVANSTQIDKIKEENDSNDDANDTSLNATIICDQSASPHAMVCKVEAEMNLKVSTSTQTLETSVDQANSLKPELDQLPVRDVFINAWRNIQDEETKVNLLGDNRHVLENLFALSPVHLDICVRLFIRRTKWQRLDKIIPLLNLEESEQTIYEILDSLDRLDYIHRDFETSETLESILSYLTVPALRMFVKARRIKATKLDKHSLITLLTKFVAEQPSVGSKTTEQFLRTLASDTLGECIRLDDVVRNALFRLQLLHHFAIPDITSNYELHTYLSDIESGRVELPEYQVTNVNAFETTAAFDRYATAIELYCNYCYQKERRGKTRKHGLMEIAEKAFSNLQELSHLPMDTSPVHRRFTAEHVYSKILTWAATDLTKSASEVKKWLFHLHHCCRGVHRGEWYDRLAMLLLKDGHHAHAESVIKAGLSSADVALVDKILLSVRAATAIKRYKLSANAFPQLVPAPTCNDVLKIVIAAKPQKIGKYQGRRLLYEEDSQLFTVEEIALRSYAQRDYPMGIHCEGALLLTLFVALFWDIIYSDVPNAHPFISRLQYIPLDLFSTDFYIVRKEAIDKRLDDISSNWENEVFVQYLWDFHVKHSDKKSVHNVRLSGDVMVEAATCIGREKLRKMLERFVKDPRQYRAGMPDLFVWNIKSKQCCFVEVKSENDVLSMKQKMWLEFLQGAGVPVELCLVHSVGEKVRKSREKKL